MAKTVLVTGAGTGIGREAALEFAKAGYDVALHYNGSAQGAQEAAEAIRALGRQCMTVQANLTQLSQLRAMFAQVGERFGGLDAQELTEQVILSHEQTFHDVLAQREKNPDYPLTTIASIPQIRMTRRIVGEYTLDDSEDHKEFADSIGMISDWRKSGPAYHVPFGTLYGRDVSNLITAGRCISVTEPMWDISRVIPPCAVTGEAAGAAAAMTDDFAALDVKRLQAHLISKGVKL